MPPPSAGAPHFDLAHDTLTAQAATLMADGTYTVLLARAPEPVGFAALCESMIRGLAEDWNVLKPSALDTGKPLLEIEIVRS